MPLDRRFIVSVILLAALAAFSQALVWLTQPEPAAPDFSGPPRSAYTLDGFSMQALDEEGHLSFTLSGPRLTRHDGDDSIAVSTPTYMLVDQDGEPWHGQADAAWVNRDGSILKLEGNVQLQRKAAPGVEAASITTANLVTYPASKKLETAAEARITRPGSILTGIGLRGDLNSKVLELLSDVHFTLEPSPRAR